MQNRITKPTRLLDEKGMLIQKGYATEPLFIYDRSKIKAPKHRIKEWDYYCIYNNSYAVCMTVADNGYHGFASSSIIDFRKPWQQTVGMMIILPLGKLHMPPSSSMGDIHFENKRVKLDFAIQNNRRILNVDFKDFYEGKNLKGKLTLYQPNDDSMVIATPFSENKRAFYYNQKINCMPASGTISLGDDVYQFDDNDSFGILDWGRGVWTYENTWYWGSASGLVDGKRFGFNIGYGFGDTSAASENMLFYDGIAHKLDQIEFHISDDYIKPWKFTSNDSRFELDFVPIIDRADRINALVIETDQHQVFGKFSGKVVLDDGKTLDIKDLVGFAEKVHNRW
jgi:hypothetical protein